MGGPEKSAEQHEKIAHRDREVLAHSQKVKPADRQTDAYPAAPANSLSPEQAGKGNENNVQTDNETGFTHRGIDDADLLQGGRGKQHDAGQQAVQPGIAVCRL